MFEVFKFECRYQLRSPLFVVLAIVFFLFAFFLMASASVRLGGVGDNLHLNAAWTIVYTQFFFSLIGMLAAIAIVSQAITRDYELKTAELFFATGIAERDFLLGRFFGGSLFGVLVGAAALLGTMTGSLMPWLDQQRLGAFTFSPYVYALLVVTIPNLFFCSALFFALAALTRSMLAAFAGAVGFMVLYIVVGNLVDPEQAVVFAIADPFGQAAFADVSRYWTVFERNTQLVPVADNLLINRLLWFGVGLSALVFTTWRYEFNLNPSPFRRRRRARRAQQQPPAIIPTRATGQFGWGTPWHQLRSQVRIDLAGVYKSVPFYAILAFAGLNVWSGFHSSAQAFGTELLPVTSSLLRAIASSYTFFILIIVIYYAGELVHRERQTGTADVIDTTPFPNIVMVASKVLALWFIVACLLLFAMLAGIVMQVGEGYTNLEPGLYLQSLFFVQGGFFFLLAIFAVFIQVLCGNKWIGMIGLLVVVITLSALPSLDFEHGLYSFGTPPAPHSDMNGFGHYWLPLAAFTCYWGLFCALLALLAHLLAPRGHLQDLRTRLRQAGSRLNAGVVSTAALLLCGFAGTGAWIFYNTNIVNTYLTTDTVEARQAAYEKAYKQYEVLAFPQVIAVDSSVDLFPQDRRLESKGSARLVNKSDEAMQEVLLSTHPLAIVNELLVAGGVVRERNDTYGVHLYRFEPALQPGQEAHMTWDITWRHDGFANPNEAAVTAGASNRVVANGTFVNNTEIMPFPGYNSGLELSDPNKRRERELPPIIRLPELGDPAWIHRSQFGVSERSAFRTVFSTSADQTAVAPGYLLDVEEREGRKYFTYEMDEPIWPFFAFVSARYEIARDRWKNVAIEVYYDAKHPYNIEPMIRGTKKSLDYFSAAFSPYQYRQFRILEFPRYAAFAQSFPNTIPYSEAIGFVADLRDEHALDLVFYVTAHELAHQWWGHQVAGAYMQGMTVIVETLAQYSALMVMAREYGPDKMRRFLRYELDRYLRSRGGEQIEELPLMLSENQPYIHYRKGSLVMYALQDIIGEDEVNRALRRFLDKYAYGKGPFPTAAQLVDEFRAVAQPAHQAMITDLFEKITVYDFAVEEAAMAPVGDEWEVTFSARATKYYADGQGVETEAPLRTWVDIAVFPEAPAELEDYQLPQPLFFEKRLMSSGTDDVVIRVSRKPGRVGIDPYNKLIDRNPEDNLQIVTES